MAQEGVIVNFRGARHHQNYNQVVVIVKGVDSKENALAIIGKAAVWESTAKKQIKGNLTATHGKGGAVRVLFEKGLPGQAIGQKIKIE